MPQILKAHLVETPDFDENFKFYTDATGNNHPVVRQILKRRTWLTRTEKIK